MAAAGRPPKPGVEAQVSCHPVSCSAGCGFGQVRESGRGQAEAKEGGIEGRRCCRTRGHIAHAPTSFLTTHKHAQLVQEDDDKDVRHLKKTTGPPVSA